MIKNGILRYEKIFKLFFFYSAIKLLILLLTFFFSYEVWPLFSIEKMFSKDLCFNDLYYKLREKTFKSSDGNLSDKIILINTGGLKSDSFRFELAALLSKLSVYQPAALGLDMYFRGGDRPGTTELLNTISYLPNIVIGRTDESNNSQDNLIFPNAVYGNITFPDKQISIRRYFSDTGTFACKLAKKVYPEKDLIPFSHSDFVINYLTDKVVTSAEIWDSDSMQVYNSGFLQLEASEILHNDSEAIALLSELGKGKVIILGHLGEPGRAIFDSEDKFKVPINSDLIDRDRTMFGVLIHANAIENIINPSIRFNVWSDSLWFQIITEIMLLGFLAFLLFAKIGKLVNITLLTIATVPFAFSVFYLMKLNIYIEMGTTLIHVMIFEEFGKIVKPLYEKIKTWLTN
jgi:hypothetical protein